ncbi:hypothetical protein JCM3765_004854 [Sporobolomyces pararoseus]
MPGFEDLAPEVIEDIFHFTQDSSPSANRSHLLSLQLVCKQFTPIARRLLYRSIHLKRPLEGKKLLECLQFSRSERLGDLIRSLKITEGALSKRDLFSDLSQDDIVRQSPNLVELDSPVSSFAPLSDGRRPFASFPPTLKSLRLSPTFHRWSASRYEDEYDSDDSEIHNGVGVVTVADALSTLTIVPASLTSLTISQTFVPDLSSSPATSLTHLRSITLDITSTPYSTLKWLTTRSIANRALKSLKVWSCASITAENLVELFDQCGNDIEEFTYKPVHEQGSKFPALRLIRRAPNLRRLSLGNKAADHTLYPLLPRTLTHLTVSLPEGHVNARLADIEPIIRTRLRKLVKFELYSLIYFPSPEISYPPVDKSEITSLREIRFSHVNTPAGALDTFLASVGSTVHTLALHHVSSPFSSTLFSYCPKLRRLELGRSGGFEDDDGNGVVDLFSTTDHQYLHSLRVHFDSSLRLDDLIDELQASRLVVPLRGGRTGAVVGLKHTYLRTLELVGSFPGDVVGSENGWTDAKNFGRLIRAAKEKETLLLINGRIIKTIEDLWAALLNEN